MKNQIFIFIVVCVVVIIAEVSYSDELCTVVSSTPTLGRCSDNGCEKAGKQCKAVDTDNDKTYDECECKPCTKKTIGARAEAIGGTVEFTGSTLTVSGLSISNVRDLTDHLDDSLDAVIGATVNIPSLTYDGYKTYSDGTWLYNYYQFSNEGTDSFTLQEGTTTYITAEIEGLWYTPVSNAFSIALANPVFNDEVSSNYLDRLRENVGQSDDWSQMFLWVTVFPDADFLANSNQFTQAYTNLDSFSGTGVCGCVPEPATVLLLSFGGLLLRRRK